MSDLFEVADPGLDKLRAAFKEVADWHLQRGLWSRADADEIGLTIKADLERADPGVLACWRAWLAQQADEVRSLKAMGGPRMRALEAAVKAERERAAA